MDRVTINDGDQWKCHLAKEKFEYCDNYDVKTMICIMKCGCIYHMLNTPDNLSFANDETQFNISTEKCRNKKGGL